MKWSTDIYTTWAQTDLINGGGGIIRDNALGYVVQDFANLEVCMWVLLHLACLIK